jgi:hypothetical protein
MRQGVVRDLGQGSMPSPGQLGVFDQCQGCIKRGEVLAQGPGFVSLQISAGINKSGAHRFGQARHQRAQRLRRHVAGGTVAEDASQRRKGPSHRGDVARASGCALQQGDGGMRGLFQPGIEAVAHDTSKGRQRLRLRRGGNSGIAGRLFHGRAVHQRLGHAHRELRLPA